MERKPNKITLFQLFFLSFSYVFSGLFLIGERSFLSLFLPLAAMAIFLLIGYVFLQCAPPVFCEQGRFLSFLSCGKPHFLAKFFAFVFIVSAAAEMLVSLCAFSVSAARFSSFLSVGLIAAILFLIAVFFGFHGLTAIGRFSELFIFLIALLFLRMILWDLKPISIDSFSENLYAAFLVMPAPIFYLLSMTVGESTAMPKPIVSRFIFPLISFLGAATAVLCTVLFLLYGTKENNLFFLFFGWMASTVRLGLLTSLASERLCQ